MAIPQHPLPYHTFTIVILPLYYMAINLHHYFMTGCKVLYWLSGLSCTDENFIIKSGAQRVASSEGIALVAPDTSPSTLLYPTQFLQLGGLNVEGEADSWDFGVGMAFKMHSVLRFFQPGAGFYLNATQEKWKNWQMYDYVVKELPKVLSENFAQLDTSRASISGHSMGGHGALTIYLKNLDKYKSVSAFAPIVNPMNCPWGQKAFTNYLGGNKADWEEYDATCLISKFNDVSATILIDQVSSISHFKGFSFKLFVHLHGEDDKFLHDQLLPHKFEEACKNAKVPLLLRLQPGYDHSYYFIATFIDHHIQHHAQALNMCFKPLHP
ncbi:S-formylglutathione hydrolase [Vitis vinifera]|uniref:S-formylglutathione hydrolase n=1 Tax=Vitis vinifera TaxID=29760 RepID=A0A438C039_VITVI|nr:S-formylglutathione hydrolase [Vitis vinifera]RVX09786.1 S-formylglutathione hydrolase [Vitis vinifera]